MENLSRFLTKVANRVTILLYIYDEYLQKRLFVVNLFLEVFCMPIDAQSVYEAKILRPNERKRVVGLSSKGKATYRGLKGRVSEYLASRSARQQFEFDVALWYGFLVKEGGTAWKKTMVLRLFAVLYYGGLMVNRGDNPDERRNPRPNWKLWCNVYPEGGEGAPICSAISHTARIVIWLPENDSHAAFWKWLWGDNFRHVQGRGAATHGFDIVDPPQNISRNISSTVIKGVKEVKGNKNANHFGVNIALGGNNNVNPISGKGIRENGKHGHLYIASYKGEIGGRKAILVGTEQSAPIDRQVAVQGRTGKLGTLLTRGISVPDQYGGAHGLGGHSRFSATGGDDFSYTKTKKVGRIGHRRRIKVKQPTHLEDYGPSWGNYIDGMYVDLTANRLRYVKSKLSNGDFNPEQIALPGQPPCNR